MKYEAVYGGALGKMISGDLGNLKAALLSLSAIQGE